MPIVLSVSLTLRYFNSHSSSGPILVSTQTETQNSIYKIVALTKLG